MKPLLVNPSSTELASETEASTSLRPDPSAPTDFGTQTLSVKPAAKPIIQAAVKTPNAKPAAIPAANPPAKPTATQPLKPAAAQPAAAAVLVVQTAVQPARQPVKLTTNCRPPPVARYAFALTFCSNLYLIAGIPGTLFWITTEKARFVSLMPLGVPICGVIAGATVNLAVSCKKDDLVGARGVFRFASVVHLFLLVACVMDSAAYLIAYSHLHGDEWYAPMFAAAAVLNLHFGFSSMFMLIWMRANLQKNKRSGPA